MGGGQKVGLVCTLESSTLGTCLVHHLQAPVIQATWHQPQPSVPYSCALSNVKKVSLELGGKSPLIIFADCDLNKAVQMVRLGMA